MRSLSQPPRLPASSPRATGAGGRSALTLGWDSRQSRRRHGSGSRDVSSCKRPRGARGAAGACRRARRTSRRAAAPIARRAAGSAARRAWPPGSSVRPCQQIRCGPGGDVCFPKILSWDGCSPALTKLTQRRGCPTGGRRRGAPRWTTPSAFGRSARSSASAAPGGGAGSSSRQAGGRCWWRSGTGGESQPASSGRSPRKAGRKRSVSKPFEPLIQFRSFG